MALADSQQKVEGRTVLAGLRRKIEQREARLGVIGLGYVGLPVACAFAHAGFHVVGIDAKPERIEIISSGISPIEGNEPGLAELLAEVVSSDRLKPTTDYALLAGCDVVFVNVETPVGEDHQPRYEALKSACGSLASVLQEGALVIIESTVSPGTTDRLVRPLLEELTGRKVNEGFYLGHCPERVMPGKLLNNLRNVSRVCGGSSPETASTMVALYRHIVQAELDMADCITAELVKTTENAYRDVQIAFANEVALVCEDIGADVWRVRELVNKSPGRQMHLPGAGVGGHCIPKDPWLLASSIGLRSPLRLIPAAREINDGMPRHMADLVVRALAEAGRTISESRVAVLGYSYLEDSDDTRNSPSEALVNRLRDLGVEVRIHDPWVPDYQRDVLDVVGDCDAAVVMVAHSDYISLNSSSLIAVMRTPILVDGRHSWNQPASADGVVCYCLGQGTPRD